MALFDNHVPPYKPARDITINWDTFRHGLNILLKDNEIKGDELSQAENLVLIGQGVPTVRWGSQLYFQSGNATGSVRSLRGFYKSNSTIELLSLTDDGYLTAKSGASYRTLTGVSWASSPSGYQAEMTQLSDAMYIVHPSRELVRYSNPTLVSFPTIAPPVLSGISNISNATGTTIKSYRVNAVSQVGETLATSPIQLTAQPATLGGTQGGVIRIVWTATSTASGILQGYNIFGRDNGNERFLAGVPAGTTTFLDDGTAIPQDFTFPPTADSTGGPKAGTVVRFQDRLIFGNLDGEGSKVLISGRVPFHERFDLAHGGNYILIEPDAGDNIVQLFAFSDRIIVFKEKSIWQISLSSVQIGNFFITQPELKLITAAHGCIAPKSVTAVDNDVFFLSREGIRSLGYQSGFSFDVLRTQEISVKIRPYFKNLTDDQLMNAVGVYFDNKYLLAFPGRDEMMVFDRERAAWMGPWTLDATNFEVFYDENNAQHLLFSPDGSVNVEEFSSAFTDDNGAAIQTILKTRNEDLGDWSLFKNIKNVFIQLRNVVGATNVTISIEQRSGTVNTVKNFNIVSKVGSSGWGADQWGNFQWGDSEADAGGIEAVFTIRWARLNKVGRLMKLVFTTTAGQAKYELLGIRTDAKPLGAGFRPSSWRT